MGCANSRVQPEGSLRPPTGVSVVDAEEMGGPDVVLLKVADLLNNTQLLEGNLKSCDVLQQYWKAQQSIAGLFGPGSFKTVLWRKLKSTEYGVLTYCWGNRETGDWGASWKQMIGALEGNGDRIKVEYVWIGARSPARAPALQFARPRRVLAPPAVPQTSFASTRTTPRRWRRFVAPTRSTPGQTSTT